jgi:putative transposase
MSINQKEALAKRDRYKVHPGEPGCSVVTDFKDGRPVLENPPVALAPQSLLPSIIQEQIQCKPVILSSRDEIAHYRLIFVKALEAEISKKDEPVLETIKRFVFGYNSGYLLPAVHKKLGPISWRTAYRFREVFDKGGVEGLVPEYGKKGISKTTDHEKNLLLTLLLHPNRLKIAYAITLTKNFLKKQGIESPSSERTLRRFADQFEKEHNDIWVLHREGEKALDDKVLPYIERDRNLLDVGEGLVADGHRLNFQMIDAFTGKPCRAAVVFFWDWRSAYPLGWEIMPEENIQCIFTAFRNAVLTLGKMPKWILIDNGKAFKAKLFTSDINLTETEILGMFARLNINVHFASPYNAKSKPIERFFETFGEQFERLMESFIGNSIGDKPAWTKRNEKLARSLHNPRIPIFSEINDRMFEWREFHVDQPSRGLGGQTPREIFDAGKGPGVDPGELVHLMMAREIKRITRNGIDLFGCYWFSEALYGLRDRVVIKYSLSDLSKIYCFHDNEFLCTLEPLPKTHPMASESGTPKDMEEVKRRITQKRGLKKQTVKLYKMLGRKAESLPWKEIIQEIPDVIETIEKIEAEKFKTTPISPFVDGSEITTEELNRAFPPDENEIQVDPETGLAKLLWVDPRSGLSRPTKNDYFDSMWEYYDWYKKIEKEFPGALNDKDWAHLRDFEATKLCRGLYGGSDYFPVKRTMLKQSAMDNESGERIKEPPFEDDHDRYQWLMIQDQLKEEEIDFIWNHRKTNFFCKGKDYVDWVELEDKARKESEKDTGLQSEAVEGIAEK